MTINGVAVTGVDCMKGQSSAEVTDIRIILRSILASLESRSFPPKIIVTYVDLAYVTSSLGVNI